jgi:ubiquinone/menaquinone biosynthesis C-methylase UbiE
MIERIELQGLFGLTAALSAAMRSGLLAALARGPNAPEDFARELSLNPRAVRLVLDVLATFDIATRDGDRFGPSKDLSQAASSTPLGLDQMSSLWSHAPEFLATGAPFIKMDAGPAQREALYANVVPSLGRMFAQAARELADRMDGERPPRRVLDIGCGSGVWSLAFAQRFADAHVTGLDFPDVLAAFDARATELGVSQRTTKLPGDMHEVAIPNGQFDLVVIANVLRLEEPARAEGMVKRAAHAVAPGGELLVVDAFSDGSPAGERGLAIYALHLSMRTSQGRVYGKEQVKEWMTAAGLEGPRELVLSAERGPVGGIVARSRLA